MDDPSTYGRVPMVGSKGTATRPPADLITPAGHVEMDDSSATAQYANFCRLLGLPEELLIDFGFNPQPMGITTQPVTLPQRTVVGWHTAKRVLHTLRQSVERHEAAFGVLETDVQKRFHRA